MVKFFVNKFSAVSVLSLLIVFVGITAYNSLPRESAPEVKVPLIFITTNYPGVSAKDMESLVTEEIEGLLDGVEDATKITSTTRQGVSAITVEFSPNTDVEVARRRVRERVDIAKADLPVDANEPIVQELNFSRQPILILNLSNPAGLEILTPTADFLEEAIKRIPGVLDVNVSGELEQEMAIELDPVKLNHYGFSIDDVVKAINNENITIPGGMLLNKALNYNLSVSGEIKDPELFNEIVVSANGVKAQISALGKASFKYKERTSYNRINGKPSISLSITKRAGENLLRIAADVKKLVEENNFRYPQQTSLDYTYDESKQIKNMVWDLENNIFSGLVLVYIITLLFLGFRNSLFVSLAIPFSMLISFFVLQIAGITLNMVVLFSLILALGMLVDNGIVIVENIFRHATMGKNIVQASIEGSNEVAWPIITSTLTTCLAFFPIIYMPGMMGEFLSYIPKTVIIVLVASLVVALTINPTFCSRFLKINEAQRKKAMEGGSIFAKFQGMYVRHLKVAVKHPVIVIVLTIVAVFSGMVVNGIAGKEPIFFPNIDPPVAIMGVELPHGTPLEKTDSLLKILEDITESTPGSVEHIQATSGRSAALPFENPEDGSHFANVRIGFMPFEEREIKGVVTIDSLRQRIKPVTGADLKVRKQEGGPPQGHPISYMVTGDDYAVLGTYSDSLLHILKEYDEVLTDIETDFKKAIPQVKIDIDREKAGMLNINTRTIASTIRNAMNGGEVSKFRLGKDEYDVIVRFFKPFRGDINALKNLEIVHEGKRIPLSSVAHIHDESDVGTIKRKNRKRAVEVWADFKEEIQGKDSIKAEILSRVNNINTPKGYYIGPGEGEQIQEEAQAFLAQAFVIALFLIFIVLIIQFNSITQPLIILTAVFLSLGGVFWGLFITQQTFVIIMTGVGIISLAGVVVNNGIVLIDFINQMVKSGVQLEEAVIEASSTRFRPVLLTAITTILGLVPMALGWSFDVHSFTIQVGSESSEWWKSLAWAVIFGLTFATALTLIVVPILVMLDYKFRGFLAGRKNKANAPAK